MQTEHTVFARVLRTPCAVVARFPAAVHVLTIEKSPFDHTLSISNIVILGDRLMSIRTSTLITAALLGLVLNAGSIAQLHADHGLASVEAVGAVAY